jgi:MFS family permease
MNHPKLYVYVITALSIAGYFVNIFLVISFALVGNATLEALEITNPNVGNSLLSVQMFGALLGGGLWGFIGDRKGRMSALFASTIICVFASFATCFLEYISNDDLIGGYSYRACFYFLFVFLVGFGLSGEIGADITLVNEVMHNDENDNENKYNWHNTWGSVIVVSIGALGGLLAASLAPKYGKIGEDDWKHIYYAGAALGLTLIILRISVYGSNLFRQLKYDKPEVIRGNWRYLFFDRTMRRKLLTCCAMGLPTWLVLGVLLKSPGDYGHVGDFVIPANTYFWSYLGLSTGVLVSGYWAYKIKSFKQPLLFFHLLGFIAIACFIIFHGETTKEVYFFKCWFTGFGRGYWGLFVALIPTYFGTNLRCLATAFGANAIRGMLGVYLIFITLSSPLLSKPWASLFLATVLFIIATRATLRFLEDTYNRNLDFEDEAQPSVAALEVE